MDVPPKIFLQIILAAEWVLQYSSMSPKQQRRPLPSLLDKSFFFALQLQETGKNGTWNIQDLLERPQSEAALSRAVWPPAGLFYQLKLQAQNKILMTLSNSTNQILAKQISVTCIQARLQGSTWLHLAPLGSTWLMMLNAQNVEFKKTVDWLKKC